MTTHWTFYIVIDWLRVLASAYPIMGVVIGAIVAALLADKALAFLARKPQRTLVVT